MRTAILASFLSLWIISIVVPSIIAIADKGQETVWVFCHTEEEQQKSGEKDKFEEKIIPESDVKLAIALISGNASPFNQIIPINSCHIQEILLPPPERIL